MQKTVIGFTAAAALVASAFAPVPAKADPISAWWLLPAFVGGLFLGSAQHRAHAGYYGPPRAQYYAPQPYAPRATVYGAPRAQVIYDQQPRAQVRARY